MCPCKNPFIQLFFRPSIHPSTYPLPIQDSLKQGKRGFEMKKIELRLEAQFYVWLIFLYSLERLGGSQFRGQRMLFWLILTFLLQVQGTSDLSKLLVIQAPAPDKNDDNAKVMGKGVAL